MAILRSPQSQTKGGQSRRMAHQMSESAYVKKTVCHTGSRIEPNQKPKDPETRTANLGSANQCQKTISESDRLSHRNKQSRTEPNQKTPKPGPQSLHQTTTARRQFQSRTVCPTERNKHTIQVHAQTQIKNQKIPKPGP